MSEVILVTSESQESFRSWQGKQVNVYPSAGNLPAMYNLGMKQAQGEYVLFCKADATLDSEFL
ncbi:MAG: glycosyltransferase family 2 protein [Ruthenibacterium lactatiformans]